jgi:glutaredoxin-related protein
LYGSKICPHCLKQKELFGDSFQYINYVECTEEYKRCADLRGVPAREFADGNIVE